ncbi:hypothetical protein ElyMa_003933000 [Elysia marginata]|uniref:Uncharacterized protein n=1 Tax=Elysia marginata TaxID=1093978 RepID=A0AAV4FTA4_9GAST|nr:hypothetical protein ElyMa_003933000 [Elysia marginata]
MITYCVITPIGGGAFTADSGLMPLFLAHQPSRISYPMAFALLSGPIMHDLYNLVSGRGAICTKESMFCSIKNRVDPSFAAVDYTIDIFREMKCYVLNRITLGSQLCCPHYR